ncbi:RluA family pseudouridine synthase [Pacificimonas flava]|uniref:Pseudouridine synthase n=1 Tax=Pacificimonas flava TaxID=1234595 RepID=M2S9R0_9SPHN|nr:RluA family pseudouridine synthase [Pacificimonas flava]EMD82120.1 Ribosomal large subunit pseudouridine synthase C [Pacificimonas flava]MBB5280400.1 23S rRNA pseudouridine955/2504/2580 synthase [Pacificimonas flava]
MSGHEDVRQFTVAPDDDDIRLDRWFKRHMPEASFTIVSKWARTGQLRVDGSRAKPGDRIRAGQVLRVPPLEAERVSPMAEKRERRPLTEDQIEFARSLVIHKDAHAIVINKPPGLATQGGTGQKAHVDGLLDALKFDRDERPKLVHRLDKDTSGVLLLARTARAAAHFSKAFSGRTARKIYWAIVMGVPEIPDGRIDLPLAKQPGTGGEKMHVDQEGGQRAASRYRRIDRAANRAAWLELQPLTGRTHQLRVHMEAIGHPIVGDGKYGGKDSFLTGGISRKLHLHARRLKIEKPDGGVLNVIAEPPEHFAASLTNLGFDPVEGDLPLEEELDDPGFKARLAKNKSRDIRRAKRDEHAARRGAARKSTGRGAPPAKPSGKKGGRPGGRSGGGTRRK